MSTGQLMLLAWPILVLVLFRTLPAHRAFIVALLGGWLFLPPSYLRVAEFEVSKVDVERLSILLGAVVFHRRALLSFRPRWFDYPAVLFCLCPLVSALANGLGLPFALVAHFREFVHVLLPYLLGRALIRTPAEFREFGIGFAGAALLYVPLCLFEVKYGLHFSQWMVGHATSRQTRGSGRGGTYRPVVLLRDGFVLTMMQGFGVLLLFWLWFSGVLRRIGPIPLVCFAILPLSVVLLARSFGSIILMFVGLATLLVTHFTRLRVWLLLLVLAAPVYMSARLSGVLSTKTLVAPVRKFAPTKVRTFEFRLSIEDAVAGEMPRKPLLGFGYYGLWWEGRKKPHLDGLWLFTVTRTGILSLALWAAFFLLPVAMFLYRTPARLWATPEAGTSAVVAVFITLVTIDALQNNYLAGPFLALMGALADSTGPSTEAGTFHQ